MATIESPPSPGRVCELDRCSRSLEGRAPTARFCSENHRSEAAVFRRGGKKGAVSVESLTPCGECGRGPGETVFYSSGPGFRSIKCADCQRTYMRDYSRKRDGIESTPCVECGTGEAWGRRKICSPACNKMRQARLQRESRKRRDERIIYTCSVCDSSFESGRRVGIAHEQPCCSQKCVSRRLLLRRYGLEPEDWRRMLAEQGGCCAACGNSFADETPRIDHCHENGHVRGLLHSACNVGIGQAHDDPEKLIGWATYLYRDSFDLRDLCVR